MADLFHEETAEDLSAQPLAARMRPAEFDEFVGQVHIVGPDSLLRRAIETDELSSVIFWGPPGCGKSTLANIIAHKTEAYFERFSAVTSGVPEVRQAIARAEQRRKTYGQRTILFVDEIHRFNKAQQDAFLPHVEAGTIILIGATTENPYFEVNAPLVSRSRVFQMEPLSDDQVKELVLRALKDEGRGLGKHKAALDDDALAHIVDVANGDARSALNALELAVMTTPPEKKGKRPAARRLTLKIAEDAIQRRALRYDKTGDEHYDVISAFIKSMRGSDPDAAVYWLARMIYAGEDPRFIARRMVVQAAEDVGNADPMALVVANAAAHAVEYVGLPEAQIPLAQAAIYIACAPKSNASYLAINRAMDDVKNRRTPPVPKHLRNAPIEGLREHGHGEGYKYPHDFPGGYVDQEYLSPDTKSRRYYEPRDIGREAQIKKRMEEVESTTKAQKDEDANRGKE